MKMIILRSALPLILLTGLSACNTSSSSEEAKAEGEAEADGHAETEGAIEMAQQEIQSAGIRIVQPTIGGSGVITMPAMIEGDPQATQVVSASIGGRVVSLSRNLGDTVRQGEVIAIIESREAAGLRAQLEASRARAALAQSTLSREQRLFAERVTPEADLIAARTAATEANIAVRLAQQQLSAAGVSGGSLNRIGIPAPVSGQITARNVVLGATVAPDAELFRVSNLSRVAVTLSLTAADAGRVSRGMPVVVRSGDREGRGTITFASPVLDETTRLVQVIATLDNSSSMWRPGEPITVAIQTGGDANTISVPENAIQTVENRTVVFVRTAQGFQATPVAIISRGGGMVVVTGVDANARIAGEGSFTLKAELGKSEAEEGGH